MKVKKDINSGNSNFPDLITEDDLLRRCDFFQKVQAWPLDQKIQIHEWLSNFDKKEKPYAIHLLNFFLFFPELMVIQMLKASVQQLCQYIQGHNKSAVCSNWSNFISSALFSWIPGETPNTTDSGYTYARMARQNLNIPQRNFMEPEKIINKIACSSKIFNIILLDDFIGSGEQCYTAWTKKYDISGRQISFFDLVSNHKCVVFYCPLISTLKGYNRIKKDCKGLRLLPYHILGEEYSVVSKKSYCWPKELKNNSYDFLHKKSIEIGIPETGVDGWKGFHDLGLALSIYNSVPDATIPLFRWQGNGWKPLVIRS